MIIKSCATGVEVNEFWRFDIERGVLWFCDGDIEDAYLTAFSASTGAIYPEISDIKLSTTDILVHANLFK